MTRWYCFVEVERNVFFRFMTHHERHEQGINIGNGSIFHDDIDAYFVLELPGPFVV